MEKRQKLHQQISHALIIASELFFHLCLDSRTHIQALTFNIFLGGKCVPVRDRFYLEQVVLAEHLVDGAEAEV